MKKIVSLFLALVMALILCVSLIGCTDLAYETTDTEKQQTVQQTLSYNQATPTDIDYSLERYNLIKRAYWVNGQRDKAMTLSCGETLGIYYPVLRKRRSHRSPCGGRKGHQLYRSQCSNL